MATMAEEYTVISLPIKSGRTRLAAFLLTLAVLTVSAMASEQNENKRTKEKSEAGTAAPRAAEVSFDKQVRPILQAHCQGCHQPAKAGGGYVMTSFDRLLKGGESDEPAIVPSKPAESYLVELITPHAGKSEMPQNKPPLAESEIALIAQWIAQGAKDDTPEDLGRRYDADHPPEYTRLPVIPALAFSPDGLLLAVAGFHEVLLWKADGTEQVGRLVGLSERDRVPRLFTRRQEAGRHRRPAVKDGRSPGLGRGQEDAQPFRAGHV